MRPVPGAVLDELGRLAGGVAHDLNNMLAVIVGHAEIIADHLGDEHPLAPEVAEVRTAADRCRVLAGELLAFGRRQVLERRPVVLGELVSGVEELLRAATPESIELVLRDESDGAMVLGDRARLEAVVVSLVSNAREAMPDGGRLTVRTTLGTDVVMVSVSDTGVGMTPDVLARVFEPFFTTKELGHGTGLGLAAVSGLIEQMGGTVRAESAPGEGSRFDLELPRYLGDRVTIDPPEPAADSDQAARILVVEDQPQVRRLVERLLARGGYDVLSAEDGKGALELLRDDGEAIDLMLTDMILPDVHGGDLAREAVTLRPGLRVLYTSGYAGDRVAREGMPPGDGFLQKPYRPERLEEALREALAARR